MTAEKYKVLNTNGMANKSQLEKELAVLTEKVRRLELIVYTVISFAILQLLGLFMLWAVNIVKK